MPITLYLATSIGLFVAAQISGSWEIVLHSLRETPLTAVAMSEGTILAGTKDGIFRSVDQGRTWEKASDGPAIPQMRWITTSTLPSGMVLAGTEPAGIFVSRDGGLSWTAAEEVVPMRDRLGWSLPYSPEAGCVRDFAAAGPDSTRIYAAVEVGGVLVSEDRGRSWHLVEGSDGRPDLNRGAEAESKRLIHPDVHSLSVHPRSPHIVTAATGGGLYRSTDGGASWENIYRCYIRAAWVDPEDPLHIIAGPAAGVARNGRIETSHDGGRTWASASDGTSAPWPRHMVERFFPANGQVFAVLSNGELWAASPAGFKWRHILSATGTVRALAGGGG